MSLDATDRHILDIVQRDGRISNADLAKRIHLSPAATHARLRRLEREEYIEGYGARISRHKLGYTMMCHVGISLQSHSQEDLTRFRRALRSLPEVLECSFVTGEFGLHGQSYPARPAGPGALYPPPRAGSVARRGAHVNTSLVVAEIKNSPTIPVLESGNGRADGP